MVKFTEDFLFEASTAKHQIGHEDDENACLFLVGRDLPPGAESRPAQYAALVQIYKSSRTLALVWHKI